MLQLTQLNQLSRIQIRFFIFEVGCLIGGIHSRRAPAFSLRSTVGSLRLNSVEVLSVVPGKGAGRRVLELDFAEDGGMGILSGFHRNRVGQRSNS